MLTLDDIKEARRLQKDNRTDPNTSVGVYFAWLLEHGEDLLALAEKCLSGRGHKGD